MPQIDPSQLAAGLGVVAVLAILAVGFLLFAAILGGLVLYFRSQNGLRVPRWQHRMLRDRVQTQIRSDAEAAFAPTVAKAFGYAPEE